MKLKVKDLLKERGMKMTDLAGILGVDQSNLTKSLEGNPKLSRLEEIATALDVPVRELLPDAPPSSPLGVLTMGDKRFALVPMADEKPKTLQDTPNLTPGALEDKICDLVQKCSKDGKTRAFFGSLSGHPILVFYDEISRRYMLFFQKKEGDVTVRDYSRFFQTDERGGKGRWEWDGEMLSKTMVEEILHYHPL